METIEDIIRRVVREEIRAAVTNLRPPVETHRNVDPLAGILILTIEETAALARVHGKSVQRAIYDGELHGRQRLKGGRWTIRRECADAWIDGRPCPHKTPTTPHDRSSSRVTLRR